MSETSKLTPLYRKQELFLMVLPPMDRDEAEKHPLHGNSLALR